MVAPSVREKVAIVSRRPSLSQFCLLAGFILTTDRCWPPTEAAAVPRMCTPPGHQRAKSHRAGANVACDEYNTVHPSIARRNRIGQVTIQGHCDFFVPSSGGDVPTSGVLQDRSSGRPPCCALSAASALRRRGYSPILASALHRQGPNHYYYIYPHIHYLTRILHTQHRSLTPTTHPGPLPGKPTAQARQPPRPRAQAAAGQQRPAR